MVFHSLIRIFATDNESNNKPNRRKIGANAFLRKAEEAYKHKGFRENWLTDSGSEGLGFESQRDHEGKRRIKYESVLSNI